MQAPRPAYKCDTDHPGSDVAGATAAALATCAAVWKTRDPDYSTECRSYAESLYEFAMTYRGTYPSMLYYMSTRFGDELAWAAGLLYLETENTTYLDDAEELYVNYTLYTRSYAFGWGDVREAVKVLLWRATNDEKYSSKVGKYLDPWMPGVRMRYTAGGMAYRHKWGSLRYSCKKYNHCKVYINIFQ
ncbi:endoglucanase G-like [Saccoglossus kowalevskii]